MDTEPDFKVDLGPIPRSFAEKASALLHTAADSQCQALAAMIDYRLAQQRRALSRLTVAEEVA